MIEVTYPVHDTFEAHLWGKRLSLLTEVVDFDATFFKSAETVAPGADLKEVEKRVVFELSRGEIRPLSVFRDEEPGHTHLVGISYFDGFSFFWRFVSYSSGRIEVNAYSDSEKITETIDRIQQILDELSSNIPEDQIVTTITWSEGSRVHWNKTSLLCPSWSDVKGNYPRSTSSRIQKTIHSLKGGEPSGKLIVWHGPPGTGKTWAIRALMRELKGSHTPIIITDPEEFLGRSSYYHHLTGATEEPCLFVLEDAADGLLAESRQSQGSHIARLLNLTDGIVAQGRDDIFIVTFNEDVKEVDPAIVRPGRLLGMAEFLPMNRDEAIAWLESKNSTLTPAAGQHSITLAELYGLVERGDSEVNEAKIRQSPEIGFRVGSSG